MSEQVNYNLDNKFVQGLVLLSQEVRSMKKDINEIKNTIKLTTKELSDCSNNVVDYQDILHLVHNKYKKFEKPFIDNNIFACLSDDDTFDWSDINSDPEEFDPNLKYVTNSSESSVMLVEEIRDELHVLGSSNNKNTKKDSYYHEV
jgi:hypothetical protein